MTLAFSLALAAELTLLTSAGSGGVGSGRYDLRVPDAVAEVGVRAVRAVHGGMVYEKEVVVAIDGLESTVAAFIANPGACGEAEPWVAIVDRDEVSFWHGRHERVGSPVNGRVCEGPDGPVHWLGADTPSGSWPQFEHRLTLTVDLAGDHAEPVLVVGRPHREFARRVALLASLVDEHTFFVDGGDFVDGASTVELGKLSLHRPLGFDTLHKLGPTALVPGAQELAAGPKGFLAEAGDLPYTAANWQSADEATTLPRYLLRNLDGARVAFVGVVSPAVAADNPRLAAEGVTLAHPVAAAQEVVDELHKADLADLIVLVCDGQVSLVRQLQQGVRGVDVLIGNPGPSVDRVEELHYELKEPYAADDRAAITVPSDGVALANLTVEDGRLADATLRLARITAEIDPDEATMARISAVRREAYPAVDRPMLPGPPDDPTARYDDTAWHKLVCEAARSTARADLAMLPPLDGAPRVPGALTEKLVLDQLARLDLIEVHEVRGDLLLRLLDKAFEVVPLACGTELGAASPLIGGRAIDPLRVYRVATTDRLLQGPIAGLFAEARSSWLLDQPTVHRPQGLTLAGAARDGLRNADDPLELLALTPSQVQSLWLVRVSRLSLSAVGFQGVGDARYEAVPETLATSPSSLTLLGDLDSALEYSDARVAWDLRQRLAFTKLSTEGVTSEPADDLRLSTSLTLPAAKVKLGSTWSPYTEALLDSELTPVEEEDGTINPHQADASLTLGVATAAGPVSRLRLGAFLLRDLSVLDKPWEAGGRVELSTYVSLGHGLSWSTALDGFVFADTPTADASDLRFKALVDTRLALPLARWLSVAPYAQAFAFAGRVPETADPAVAYTLGAALDVAGAFRL